jgi:hypothetical protein
MPSLYVNCKFWKYKIENRKIKYFLSTHTENIEIVDIDENQYLRNDKEVD